MLVLSRKSGQKLIIANEIEITILETKGDSVKIGIAAPRHISVYREEIYDEIRKSNQQANLHAQTSSLDIAALAARKMNATPSDVKSTPLSIQPKTLEP